MKSKTINYIIALLICSLCLNLSLIIREIFFVNNKTEQELWNEYIDVAFKNNFTNYIKIHSFHPEFEVWNETERIEVFTNYLFEHGINKDDITFEIYNEPK